MSCMRAAGLLGIVFAVLASAGCAHRPGWEVGASWDDLSPQSLARLREAGVTCIETGLGDVMKLPADERAQRCREIAENCRTAGVRIWSVHLPFGGAWDYSSADPRRQEAAMKKIREVIPLCEVLKPAKTIVHASAEPVKDAERSARLEICQRALAELTGDFSRIGVQLCVEDLPRTCLGNTSDEILWLIRDIPELGVCFDTNHLLKETPEEFVRKVGGRIVTLHVSDYDGKDERHWMAGEGIVRWPAVVGELRRAGYAGPFLYETGKHRSGAKIGPDEYARFLSRL